MVKCYILDYVTERVSTFLLSDHYWTRKRKTRYSKEKIAPCAAPKGFQWCKQCGNFRPLQHFNSLIARRDKQTVLCAKCRDYKSEQRIRPSTKRGQCRQLYLDWKRSHKCEVCGTSEHIEADHIDPSQKVKSCSQYAWWANQGGVEQLQLELDKCRAICIFCHRVHSRRQREMSKCKTRQQKREYVNAIKRSIGACKLCLRPIRSDDELSAFDFDHIDQLEYKDRICKMVQNYSLKEFYACIDKEISRCRLICCLCHKSHTDHQRHTKRLGLKRIVPEA